MGTRFLARATGGVARRKVAGLHRRVDVVKTRCDVAVDADFPSRSTGGFDNMFVTRHGHWRRQGLQNDYPQALRSKRYPLRRYRQKSALEPCSVIADYAATAVASASAAKYASSGVRYSSA
jgi:hypothetical protein